MYSNLSTSRTWQVGICPCSSCQQPLGKVKSLTGLNVSTSKMLPSLVMSDASASMQLAIEESATIYASLVSIFHLPPKVKWSITPHTCSHSWWIYKCIYISMHASCINFNMYTCQKVPPPWGWWCGCGYRYYVLRSLVVVFIVLLPSAVSWWKKLQNRKRDSQWWCGCCVFVLFVFLQMPFRRRQE